MQELGRGADVVADWFIDSAERRELRVSIDFGFLDVSFVSIRQVTEKTEDSFWYELHRMQLCSQ